MNFTRVKLDAQLLLLQVVVFWQTQPQVCRAKGILRGAHISGDASARLSGMMDQCDAQFPTWFGARNVPSQHDISCQSSAAGKLEGDRAADRCLCHRKHWLRFSGEERFDPIRF